MIGNHKVLILSHISIFFFPIYSTGVMNDDLQYNNVPQRKEEMKGL